MAAVAAVTVVALVNRPATKAGEPHADYVIIAGAPGLRWDDISPSATPALWRLADRGSIGALAVRSASGLTCPADGWLTLGAGNLARWHTGTVKGPCPPIAARIDRPDAIGARVRDQKDVVDHNRRLAWGAQPGALAESVRCTVAIGPGAAIAAARPIGRVDRYSPELPAAPAPVLSECVLSIVDLGTVAGSGAERAASITRADAAAARVLAARPDRSLVLVAGLADTEKPSRLHVAIADGPGYEGGWLASSSTGRSGYVQLFDLAATALSALDEPRPARLFAGSPAGRFDGRPADLDKAVAFLADADEEAVVLRDVASRFFVGLVVVEVLILIAAIPLLLWTRSGSGPRGPRTVPAGLRRAADVLLAGSGLAVPAALAADLVPWWRTDSPGLVFTLVWVVALGLGTAGVLLPALRRRTLGTMGAGATAAAAVVVFDLFSGGSLQLNGVGGYSAVEGARYAGIGTIGLGVFVAGLMLAAGVAAQRVARSWRPVAVAVLGCVGVVIVGSPYFGSDAAGAIALTAGVCVSVVMATGGWLTVTRLGAAVIAGLVVTTAFAALDLSRVPAERGSLGRFLTAIQDGSAGLVVQRVSSENVASVATNPLSVLAAVSAVFVFFVLLQHWGGLRRLFGIYPALRAVAAGIAVAVLLGGFLNGAGLTVAGAAAATALPLVTLSALRALAHADRRTATSPAGAPLAGAAAGSAAFPGAVVSDAPAAGVDGGSPSPDTPAASRAATPGVLT
jgi:hypothetical protein